MQIDINFIMLDEEDEDLVAACDEWESSQLTNENQPDKKIVTPLTDFRNGYLWVSDLCSQMWCEQQIEYKLTAPVKEPESEQMAKGSELHLERELETQDYVDVKVSSDEDIFAVKVINLTQALLGFANGIVSINREVPIFGTLGESETLFLGKIDEINIQNDSLEIVEFKTRTRNVLPGKAQKETHEIQVMAYKQLVDKLICEGIKTDTIYSILHLDGKKNLGSDVLKHCKAIGKTKVTCLDDLIYILNDSAKFLSIVKTLKITYTSQSNKKCFAEQVVQYNEEWFSQKVNSMLCYWVGKRQTEGVDIEDAWKCQSCYYADNCTWRKTRARELAEKNKTKIQLKIN